MPDTPEDTIADALAFAHRLLDDVGPELRTRFGSIRQATVKGDGTLVTQADIDADSAIAQAIGRRYPDHDLVSEELDTIYDGAPWCWIVDPIDGTTNFARGVPIWGTSIALAHAGWPVMGIFDLPMLGIRYHAVRGQGAWENGAPIEVLPDVDPDSGARYRLSDPALLRNHIFAICSRTPYRFAVNVPLKLRIIGSAAYNFCLAASGVSVASLDSTPKVWDMAAGWLLVSEAGGVVVQLDGDPMFPLVAGRDYRRIAYPQLSAANMDLAEDILDHIQPTQAAAP
jgi:myo-inositol-1(or 4)-monophosphatase